MFDNSAPGRAFVTPDTVQGRVAVSRDADVGIITLDHPPVNALNHTIRFELLAALGALGAEPAVTSIVIGCAGRTFVAGADIQEFARPSQPPHLPEITEAMEESRKPIVVALHGTVLGGGFELAMAAHWRVAAPDTQFGLPEVKLGLLPGSGGTQRLPRLVGVERALAMVTSGASIGATDALAWGAIDEIAPHDAKAAAFLAARRLASSPERIRRTGTLSVPPVPEQVFVDAVARAKTFHGSPAVRACISAIRAAATGSLREGLAHERALFLELRASPESAAMRHAFLGERAVAVVPDLSPDTPTRPIATVAVIGAGTMGAAIALCFLDAGLPVTLLEADQSALDRGLATIRKTYATGVRRGSLTEEQRESRLSLLAPTLSWQELGAADLLIEAVFEDLDVKRQVLLKMDGIAKRGAILATNTSYLDVALLAASTRRPGEVIGLHFFSPANIMRLLEVVRTSATLPEVQATAMKVGRRLRKVPVMVRGSDGFVGNRMLAHRTREAYFLLEEGALPEQIDKALVDFGFPMGPFAVGDLAGLDIGWRNRRARAHLRRPGVRDCDLLDKVCHLERFGQKSGAGWYRYEQGSRQPKPDPLIEQMIVEHSRERRFERRVISDQEIVERCLYTMINEGYRILEEGVALRAIDIDMVWIHGYGFPPWRGGPMFYAEQTGPALILEVIERLRERFGDEFWTPARLLQVAAQA